MNNAPKDYRFENSNFSSSNRKLVMYNIAVIRSVLIEEKQTRDPFVGPWKTIECEIASDGKIQIARITSKNMKYHETLKGRT